VSTGSESALKRVLGLAHRSSGTSLPAPDRVVTSAYVGDCIKQFTNPQTASATETVRRLKYYPDVVYARCSRPRSGLSAEAVSDPFHYPRQSLANNVTDNRTWHRLPPWLTLASARAFPNDKTLCSNEEAL